MTNVKSIINKLMSDSEQARVQGTEEAVLWIRGTVEEKGHFMNPPELAYAMAVRIKNGLANEEESESVKNAIDLFMPSSRRASDISMAIPVFRRIIETYGHSVFVSHYLMRVAAHLPEKELGSLVRGIEANLFRYCPLLGETRIICNDDAIFNALATHYIRNGDWGRLTKLIVMQNTPFSPGESAEEHQMELFIYRISNDDSSYKFKTDIHRIDPKRATCTISSIKQGIASGNLNADGMPPELKKAFKNAGWNIPEKRTADSKKDPPQLRTIMVTDKKFPTPKRRWTKPLDRRGICRTPMFR
jgi:hypothetical protein